MKAIVKFMKSGKFLTLLLFLLAVISGANANISMCMADTITNPGAHQSQTPTENEHGEKTDMAGTVASATNVNDSDIAAREIDKYIAKFRPWKFTSQTDMFNLARVVNVTKYNIEHPVSGVSPMDCIFLTGLSSKADTLELTIGTDIETKYSRMFAPWKTVKFNGVNGYNGTENIVDGNLIAQVTARTASKITLVPINGYYSSSSHTNQFPEIPANTKLSIMANACAESQKEVAPENYIPTTVEVYLQKKITNIVLTDDFKKQIKELPFFEEDIRDNALYNHRRAAERTLWEGVKHKKRILVNDTMGEEDVYFSEGILRQLLNKYVVDRNAITFNDLNTICLIQFGKDSANDVAQVYCGDDFMKSLLNLDFTKVIDMSLSTKVDEFGILISTYKCPFGILEFKKCPVLNDLGYSDCAAVIDMKNATRYVKFANDTSSVDMNKGGGAGGETRAASRDIWIEADCLCLRGYNSMLIGPAESIYNAYSRNNNNEDIIVFDPDNDEGDYTNLNPVSTEEGSMFASTTSYSDKLVDGLIVYLKKADPYSHYNMGDLIYFDAGAETGKEWKKYTGKITV